jgi:hypothetical protein
LWYWIKLKLVNPAKPYYKQSCTTIRWFVYIGKINSSKLDNYTKEYVIGKLRFKPGAKKRVIMICYAVSIISMPHKILVRYPIHRG